MIAFAKPDNIVNFPQKSNEWYTPFKYIEAAREVMGGIDLDPASCAKANEIVQATRYYTQRENGLEHPWQGCIWCNPPYGRTNNLNGGSRSWQGHFVHKALTEWNSGRMEQGILLLLGNSCFTRYFQALWNFPLCFHDGVLTFQKASGEWDDFGFGTIFVYLGSNEAKFIDVFSKFGRIAKAIDIPRQTVQPLSLWEVEHER